jgi:hypothetical protein
MSKDTFYFSHDYNARNDIKIKKLIAKHNYNGYGLFWAIIEDLYNNANALPLDYECIAFDLRADIEILKSIINDFDLFVIKDGSFGSLSVERRLEQRNNKSLKARQSANKRWNNNKDDANALQTHYDSNAIKERKGKENKENEIKDITALPKFSFYHSLITYGGNENLVSDWLKVRKTKKATNTETAYKKFINQVEKSGHSINDVLEKCIEKSWSGFEADWYSKSITKNKTVIDGKEFSVNFQHPKKPITL